MSWPIRMRSEYVTMSITSSRKREENKKYVAPPKKEGPRLPNYGQRQRISTRQIYYSIL